MLTPDQRAAIRLYLGWESRYFDVDSALEMGMNAIDQLTDGGSTLTVLTTILSQLAAIDASLTDALSRIKVLQLGTIELPGQMEVATLRSEGRRFVGRLSSVIGVRPRHDVFSGAAARPSNLQPLG